jgi:hypothetical protein
MRLRWARASLRSSEVSSERGRLRGGPSVEEDGDAAAEVEGEGREESRDGLTVVEGIIELTRVKGTWWYTW